VKEYKLTVIHNRPPLTAYRFYKALLAKQELAQLLADDNDGLDKVWDFVCENVPAPNDYYQSPCGGSTTVVISIDDQEYIGKSKCNVRDTYRRRVGMNIALRNIINANPPPEVKRFAGSLIRGAWC